MRKRVLLFLVCFAVFSCRLHRGVHTYSQNYDIPAISQLIVWNSSGGKYQFSLQNFSNDELIAAYDSGKMVVLKPYIKTVIEAKLSDKVKIINKTSKTAKFRLEIINNKFKLKETIDKL